MVSGDHYICGTCGYEWRTRKDVGGPHQCPKCQDSQIEEEGRRRRRIVSEAREERIYQEESRRRQKIFPTTSLITYICVSCHSEWNTTNYVEKPKKCWKCKSEFIGLKCNQEKIKKKMESYKEQEEEEKNKEILKDNSKKSNSFLSKLKKLIFS
jgi:predicted Zn-ribbon and HTH transcriptional regulator